MARHAKGFLRGNGHSVNRVDLWLLGSRDPNAPATQLQMIRQRGIILLALTIAVMGVGLMLWSFQKDYRQQDQLAEQQRQQLVTACDARNVQSHDSQKLLRRIANAEEAENQDSASFLRDLANKTSNPELRTVLLRQAVLELDRDKSVADIFLELANNIKFPDCSHAAGDQ